MMKRTMGRLARVTFILGVALCVTACATGPNANPRDPFEPMNRSISSFNDTVDDNVLRPVATGYRDYTPDLFQKGVNNFFRNLSDVWSTVNNGLQLKGLDAVESGARVLINTTVGIYGIFDVATELKLDRHPEDFGQTLGYWGMPSGPYVVLPLLGPSTVRDTASMTVDTSGDFVRQYNDVPVRNVAMGVRIVDKRANLLRATDMLAGASIDKYSFTRDSYLQYRLNQVYDGNPPEQDQLVDPSAESPRPSSK